MKYALLIYENPDTFANRGQPDESEYYGAWRAYYRSLVDAGVYVGGEPLHAPETGTTVRHREGKKHIQDGPYANTKEQLAGFIVLELPSLDLALAWASRCPATAVGAVEVRPLAPERKRRLTCSDD
ncbi:MAG: YciI family protein [Gammaproteobacteria bacterium]